jgi:AraC-like DNA-binding protein
VHANSNRRDDDAVRLMATHGGEDVKNASTRLKSRRPTRAVNGSPARSAWSRREDVLTCVPSEPLQARFIQLIREHCHEAYREPHAAADVRVGVRHLARLVKRWFGYSPRIIVGLLRVESVTRGLRTSRRGMKELAAEHGYPSRQAMNRHFLAYTGMLPAAYRVLVTQTVMSDNDPLKSENGLSPSAGIDGINSCTNQFAASNPEQEDRSDASAAKSLPVLRPRSIAVRPRNRS